MENFKRISVSVTPELHRQAKLQCAKDDVTISHVIQEKLKEYLIESKKREEGNG